MSDLRAQIVDFLGESLPPGAAATASDPVNVGGGSSKVNWAFDAVWTQPDGARSSHELMLRQQPDAGVVDTNLGQEFALLRALAATGLPTPEALWADLEPRFFGAPSVVVRRSRGVAHRGALRDKDPMNLGPETRFSLARSFVDLLAAVHAVDVTAFAGLLPESGADPAGSELVRWETELDVEALDPRGRLEPVRAWLHAHVPAPLPRPCLVHGDYRPANVLIENGSVSALLDWELAHLGDPADDLGWYTCSIYRVEHFPDGWTIQDFLARYGACGGSVPHPDRLRFWQVLSVFRLAVIALRGARNVERGLAAGPPPPADRVVAAALQDIAS